MKCPTCGIDQEELMKSINKLLELSEKETERHDKLFMDTLERFKPD